MKGIFNIEQLGEPIVVQSQKAEGGKLYKRIALLREMGERHGDVIMVTILGDLAQNGILKEEDIVLASIHFNIHEYNGQTYQDATLNAAHLLVPASK